MRNLALYSWANGSFIMIVVFGLVIVALVGAVLLMMNSGRRNKKIKKEDVA